jgi:hypothetical protein
MKATERKVKNSVVAKEDMVEVEALEDIAEEGL